MVTVKAGAAVGVPERASRNEEADLSAVLTGLSLITDGVEHLFIAS